MLAALPESPRFVDDEFDVTIHAHTGAAAFALKGWSFTVRYDVSVLSLSSSSFSRVYQSPTTADDSSAGTFDAVTTGIDPSYSNSDVQGLTSLYLATLSFVVVGGAGETTSNVLSGTVGSMVNQGTQLYVSDAEMSVTDSRSGEYTEGQLAVEEVAVVGALAYAGSSLFVNTAVLDGTATSTGVRVVEVYSRPAQSSSEQTSSYICSSLNSTIVGVASSSCTVSVSSEQTSGGRTTIEVARVEWRSRR
jgi:hypothetical protein